MEPEDVLHQISGPGITWSRVNMAESVVGVQTPVSWSLWDAGGEMGFRLGYRALGLVPRSSLVIPDSIDQQFTAIFHGRGACNIDTFVAAMAAMPGAGTAAEEGFFGKASGRGRLGAGWRPLAVRAWLPVAGALLPFRLRRLRRSCEAFWRATTAPGTLADPAAAKAALAEAQRRLGPAVGMQVTASTFTSIFYGKVQQLLASVGRPDLELRLIGGYGSMQEIQLTKDLWRTARTGGGLDAFLAEHGFHGPAEGELSRPSWREDPAPIVAMLAKFTSMEAVAAPDVAERAQIDARRSAEREVLAALTGRARVRARLLLALSRRFIPLRVEAKAAFMQVFDAARAAVRARADQLVAEGRLGSADDVCYLTVPELLDALPADVDATVAARRATHDRYLATDLPLEWVGVPEPFPLDDGATAGAPDGDGAAGLPELTALGASGGTVEGTARVLVDPSDPDSLEPGDVLVCHTTDPSWSSHFFVASAVVIDIGGALSHGAIVARELGIPCVIGTQDGSRVIRSGDRVRVDGDAGTVAVLERAS